MPGDDDDDDKRTTAAAPAGPGGQAGGWSGPVDMSLKTIRLEAQIVSKFTPCYHGQRGL